MCVRASSLERMLFVKQRTLMFQSNVCTYVCVCLFVSLTFVANKGQICSCCAHFCGNYLSLKKILNNFSVFQFRFLSPPRSLLSFKNKHKNTIKFKFHTNDNYSPSSSLASVLAVYGKNIQANGMATNSYHLLLEGIMKNFFFVDFS